ncbi:MAG: phosphatase PAP2 family protein [Dehalococcoidia bacterium]
MDVTSALSEGVLSWGRWLLVAALLLLVLYRGRQAVNVPRFLRELALVVFAYFAYFLVRGYTEGNETRAIDNAEDLIRAERALGILWEPHLQSLILDSHHLVTVANWMYIWGHWPLIVLVAAWLYVWRPDTYRLFRNAFIISGAIGLVIFMMFPVAPPRLTDLSVVDTVTQYSRAYRVLQPPALVNQYAAVPSLHFGWNLLIGIALIRESRSFMMRAFGVLLPGIMFLAIVLTANHYILDAVAGGAVALAGLLISANLAALSSARSRTETSMTPIGPTRSGGTS